jgi:ATP-dependent DNA helicase RecG
MDFPPALGEMTGQTLGETRVETPGEILELLKDSPRATIPEVARCLGKSESAIERAIHKLKSEGRLMRSGARKNGRWVVVDSGEAP